MSIRDTDRTALEIADVTGIHGGLVHSRIQNAVRTGYCYVSRQIILRGHSVNYYKALPAAELFEGRVNDFECSKSCAALIRAIGPRHQDLPKGTARVVLGVMGARVEEEAEA